MGTEPYEQVVVMRAADRLALLPAGFRWSQARQAGLSDPQLHRLLEQGTLQRTSHGVYVRADQGAVDLDLVEIALASPAATLCLATALAHHDLTDQIPAVLDVAVPRNHRRPVTHVPVRWHRFAADTFHLGRELIIMDDGIRVGLYSAERSIIDAYRLRHLEGNELGRDALRRWLARPGARPVSLLRLAANFPKALPRLRADLEVLV